MKEKNNNMTMIVIYIHVHQVVPAQNSKITELVLNNCCEFARFC